MSYENIIVEKSDEIITVSLNRPDALNALNDQLMDELLSEVDSYEKDDSLRCMILTGSEKAFAAGADIKQMQLKTYMDVYKEDFITKNWERVSSCRKPIIAAVSGYALGGGCELAMMCDFILASEDTTTVKNFVNIAFSKIGINLIWKGKGLNEIAIDKKTKDICVKIDKNYFRPNELDYLKGDATKVKKILKWKQKHNLDSLINEMVQKDIEKIF